MGNNPSQNAYEIRFTSLTSWRYGKEPRRSDGGSMQQLDYTIRITLAKVVLKKRKRSSGIMPTAK